MKSPVWRALALFTLAVLVVGMAADANAARRSSFAGNYFIDDADDMFAFPQLYAQYQNMAIIDMAPGSGSIFKLDPMMNGNATLTWGGENHTLRFSTGRADLAARTALFTWGGFDRAYHIGYPLSSIDGLFGMGPAARNIQWWDFGWATQLGEMPFGVAFSWAADSFSDEDGTDPETDESFNNFGFQFGLSPNENLDLAAEIGFGSYTDDSSPTPDPSNDFSTMNFGLTARGDIDGAFGFDWRYLAGFAYAKWSPDADGAEDAKDMGLRGSFGPVFGDPGAWEVAGYITLDYRKFDENDDVSDKAFTLPGYNLAGEYYLNDWFVFRAGVASAYVMTTEEDGDAEEKYKDFYYMYTAGFGVDKGSFGLDFALEEGELHSGYFLNGDTGGDVFGYISAWFNW